MTSTTSKASAQMRLKIEKAAFHIFIGCAFLFIVLATIQIGLTLVYDLEHIPTHYGRPSDGGSSPG